MNGYDRSYICMEGHYILLSFLLRCERRQVRSHDTELNQTTGSTKSVRAMSRISAMRETRQFFMRYKYYIS